MTHNEDIYEYPEALILLETAYTLNNPVPIIQ